MRAKISRSKYHVYNIINGGIKSKIRSLLQGVVSISQCKISIPSVSTLEKIDFCCCFFPQIALARAARREFSNITCSVTP